MFSGVPAWKLHGRKPHLGSRHPSRSLVVTDRRGGDDRVSLHPLTFEEALGGLLATLRPEVLVADKHPRKDYEEVIRAAEEAWGFTRERRNKKMRVTCSCGRHMTHVALTPSSQRTLLNFEAALKRMHRECEQRDNQDRGGDKR